MKQTSLILALYLLLGVFPFHVSAEDQLSPPSVAPGLPTSRPAAQGAETVSPMPVGVKPRVLAEKEPALPVEAAVPVEQANDPAWAKIWKMTALSTTWYLAYSYGESAGERFNQVSIGRGYVTLKLKPVEWFEPRITLDAHQNDEGDFAVRLKYLHAKFILPIETAVITEPNVEAGLVHNPWFDYEEHINRYRMEGTMFIERNGLLNSADLGITVGGLLGRKLDQSYQDRVSSKYPGKYGSFAFGFYNGGGYHAEEVNQNKVFMSRISLRPLGFIVPHWQVSYFLIYGKGNTEESPQWVMHDVMTSFEHEYFVLTAQLVTGLGNAKGSMVTENNEIRDYIGYSFFGELKLPCILSSVMARFDWFNWDTDGGDPATSRLIAGYAFHFYKKSFALLSVDRVAYDETGHDSDWQGKLTLQIQVP